MSTWTLKEKSVGDLEVVIEGEEWEKAVEKAFNKIAKNLTIKGFRKGKAPKSLLEKQVSAGERQVQAVEDNANAWMRAALDENSLEPISQPQLDIKEIDAAHAVLTFTFAVEPKAVVTDYKGLPYEIENTEVSEDEFNAELDRMRKQYADIEDKEGEAENGDTVNIDYEGFKDGVAFDGGKAEGYDLVLGSGSFIPGFEDQLVGVKAGDEKELHLTFPEEYPAEDLAGQEVVFNVKVNAVKTEVLPEVDDDFAKDVNIKDVETVEDLKKTIRERLENSKKSEAERNAENKLMEKFLEKVEADIPDVMIEEETQNQINQMASQLQQYGMSLTSYLQMMGQTAEDLKNTYAEQSRNNVKTRLGLREVAALEGFEVSDEDLDKEMQNIADMYNMSLEDVKNVLSADLVKNDILAQKAYDFLKDNAEKVIVEASAEAEETTEDAAE